jgi:voltage-gated potassium channel
MAPHGRPPEGADPSAARGVGSGADDLGRERWELLRQVNALLDGPMVVLSFVWLALTIIDFTRGLGRTLGAVSYAIWALFVLHFLIGIVIAPSKRVYLRHNWLTALALVLPAFRVLRVVRAFRLLRAARAARSVSLLRLFTTLNRGMRAVNRLIGHRGFGYVLLLTVMVTFGGAAGMAQFESPSALGQPGAGLDGYGEALWWTAMTMTTMGSDYFPHTLEGRVLGWLLALYAFTVFGYITATIASLLLTHGAGASGSETAGDDRQPTATELGALRQEVAALRIQVAALAEMLDRPPSNDDEARRHADPDGAAGETRAAVGPGGTERKGPTPTIPDVRAPTRTGRGRR